MKSKEDQVEKLPKFGKVEETKSKLKLLPSHLKYMFLDEGGNKPVVINNNLALEEEKKLIQVLKNNEGAIG
jgi:hypothetical protein